MKKKSIFFNRSKKKKDTLDVFGNTHNYNIETKINLLNSIAESYFNLPAKRIIENISCNVGNDIIEKNTDVILNALIHIYEDGVISKDGQFIIRPNIRLSNYYKYIFAKRIKKEELCGVAESKKYKEIIDAYEMDYEEIEKSYFDVLRFKYTKKEDIASAQEKISISKAYLADLRKLNDSKSTYIRTLAIIESLKYGEFKEFGNVTNLDKLNNIIDECSQDGNIQRESKLYKLLNNIYLNGIKDNFGIYIVEPRKKQDNEDREIQTSKEDYPHAIEKSGKSYVCSDIHGQFEVYNQIVNSLKENDKLYIIGDVIDKGKDGIKILQNVIERTKKGQVEFILGNHEIMMLKAVQFNIQMDLWLDPDNGGATTYEEYQKLSETEKRAIISFLAGSLIAKNITVNSQKIQLVHANRCIDYDTENISFLDIVKRKYGPDVTEKELTWERKLDEIENDVIAVVGHNPNSSRQIETNGKYFKIDCGAASGSYGRVAVLCLDNFKVRYYDIKDQERE